jgi:hypothetical protein
MARIAAASFGASPVVGDARLILPAQTHNLVVVQPGGAVTSLAEVFEVKRQGFNPRRGAVILAVMLVPLIILGIVHQEKYFLSVAFGPAACWPERPRRRLRLPRTPDGRGRHRRHARCSRP